MCLLLAIFLTSCSSPSSGPELSIQALSATEVTTGTVALNFNVRSSEPLTRVIIDWGDNTATELDSNLSSVSEEHTYESWQTYSITITAITNSGQVRTRSTSITINQPNERCISPPIVDILGEFCAAYSLDFLKLRVFYRNAGVEIDIITLDPNQPTLRLPAPFLPAFLFPFMELGFDFETQMLSITLESCPLVGCFQLWHGTLQL